MPRQSALRAVLFLGLKFLLLAPVCMVAWWAVLPAYAWCLGQTVGMLLKHIGGLPIEALAVTTGGVLNTGSVLSFTVAARAYPIKVAPIVSNVPTYVTLILATPDVRMRRRLLILGLGVVILLFGHGCYVLLGFVFRSAIQESPQIPDALGQLFITLPFVLWILLAYWHKLAAVFSRQDESDTEDG